ncbi:MAG: pyruvate kinase, partial [Candidatus Helarchaeales archaeon]
DLKQDYYLHKDGKFILTTRKLIGDDKIASINYDSLPRDVQEGDLIYVNDGIVALQVESTDGVEIKTRVLAGGPISSRKGINVPKSKLSISVPTEKDESDIRLAARLETDLLAVSFVEKVEDLKKVKDIIKEENPDLEIPLISKIERASAVKNFQKILDESYGVMCARGDLGVELPTEDVPMIQKELILSCNRAGKPVIVATQMLESMTNSPIPTRAETNDVFNAVLDGADAVMLSAETAKGKYPIESVRVMDKICRAAEKLLRGIKRNPDHYDSSNESIEEVLGHAVHRIIRTLQKRKKKLRAILVSTRSGFSAQMVAKYRPNANIIATTFDERTCRKLNLVWGVRPLFLNVPESMDQFSKNYKSIKLSKEKGLIGEDDIILFVSASFLAPRAKTSTISLYRVGDIDVFE